VLIGGIDEPRSLDVGQVVIVQIGDPPMADESLVVEDSACKESAGLLFLPPVQLVEVFIIRLFGRPNLLFTGLTRFRRLFLLPPGLCRGFQPDQFSLGDGQEGQNPTSSENSTRRQDKSLWGRAALSLLTYRL